MSQTGIPAMAERQESGTTDSPVDDATYNLIAALHSKLEGLDVMSKYASNDQSGIFEQIAQDDRRHAERLLEALRQRLGSSGSGTA
jgi:rubrerythrin